MGLYTKHFMTRALRLHQPVMAILIVFLTLIDAHAVSKSGSSTSDATYTLANQLVYTGVSISGAPAGSVITSINVSWNVDSNYISDIDWFLDCSNGYVSSWYTDMSKTGDDWLDGYSETSSASKTLYPSAGTSVNGTWYFNIKDTYNDSESEWNKGRIDEWSITINYTEPAKSGDITGADPDSFTGTAKTVTISVKNLGLDTDNLIVEVYSKPSGWSVSPSSKQTIVPYGTTNSSYFSFTVTPPASDSSGSISWRLYYDDFGTTNTLLDTYSQNVNNTVPETITTPNTPSGLSDGIAGQNLTYSTGGSTTNKSHTVEYRFDWGDGSTSTWSSTTSRYHSYTSSGTYTVKAQARCATHTSIVSSWSSGKNVSITYGEKGDIISITPSSLSVICGSATSVTVRVQNTGDPDDMLIEPASTPSGWSISPSDRNPYMNHNTTYDAQFTVTAPASNSASTITWEFRDDDVTSNDLVDSQSQSIICTVPKPATPTFSQTPPSILYPYQEYTVVTDHTHPVGAGSLKYVYLRLAQNDNELTNRQTVMWALDSSTPSLWTDETAHLYDISATKSTISGGYRVTWKFKARDTWIPNTNVDYYAWSYATDNQESVHAKNDRNADYILFDLRADDIYACDSNDTKLTGEIYTGSEIYVCFAWTAVGSGNIPSFRRELFLDGGSVGTSDATATGGSSYITKYGPWTATEGSHAIRGLLDNNGNQIRESNEGNNEVSKSGAIVVSAAPVLSVSQTSLDFGSLSASKTITIQNTGGGTLSWSITKDQPWIEVTPIAGTTTTETDTIAISLDRSHPDIQNVNEYNGTIIIAPNTGQPLNVYISLDVYHEVIISDVPVYENSEGSGVNDYDIPNYNGVNGICVATAIADITAYWDRTPYNGILYWNLVDNGIAPLRDSFDGHINSAGNVSEIVITAGAYYYRDHLSNDVNKKAAVELIFNEMNDNNDFDINLDDYWTVSYLFGRIVEEIDAGRPVLWGVDDILALGGGHSMPVIGYRKKAPDSESEAWVNLNAGGTGTAWINWYGGDTYDVLTDDITSIIPGGTPTDKYEPDDIENDANLIDPNGIYLFRQTHNFFQSSDVDWVKFDVDPSKRYTVTITNRGSNYLLQAELYDSGSNYLAGKSSNAGFSFVYDSYSATTVYLKLYGQSSDYGPHSNFDVEVDVEDIIAPETPAGPYAPVDDAIIATLTPAFSWGAFQDGGDGASQSGYQLRVRCDDDNDDIVYDTGFVASTSGHNHTYQAAGTYSGWDSTAMVERISQSLEYGKKYHWHVRYRDSDGHWSQWSNDDPNPHQDFFTKQQKIVVTGSQVSVPENSTATIKVRLAAEPPTNITVTITRVSGDTDISIQSGASLVFNTANYNQDQTVTLAAASDSDIANGTATFRLSLGSTDIFATVSATEIDNDALNFLTDDASVDVPEGGTNTFNVWLNAQPLSTVVASVNRSSGDTDISVQSGVSLAFSTSNWQIPQKVTLAAAEDTDTTNGEAQIVISSSGVSSRIVFADEVDNDTPAPVINTVTPQNGLEGEQVTLNGSHFGATQGSGQVVFSTDKSASIVAWSNTQITCTVPTGAVDGCVKVINSEGTSNCVSFAVAQLVQPDIAPIADQTAVEGTVFTFSPTRLGGSLPMNWTLGASPGSMAINRITGAIEWPTPDLSGSPYTVTVQATNDAGQDTESFQLTVKKTETRIIRLSGNLQFDQVEVGKSATRLLTIFNDGNAPLTITGITYPEGFSGTWNGFVQPNASVEVIVTFTPMHSSQYSGEITVNSNKTSGVETIPCNGEVRAIITPILMLLLSD